MASKTVCIFVVVAIAAFSSAQAEVFNIPCEFQVMSGTDWYACVINDVTVPDDENLEIVFVGEHLPGPGLDDSRVEWVDIRRSNIPFIMSELFTTFPNLEILNHPTNLLRIHPNAFANASNLDQFSTQSNTKLQSIPANAFAGARNLRFLMIRFGGVQTIDENAFNGLENLNNLILEGQDLEQTNQPVQGAEIASTSVLGLQPSRDNSQPSLRIQQKFRIDQFWHQSNKRNRKKFSRRSAIVEQPHIVQTLPGILVGQG